MAQMNNTLKDIGNALYQGALLATGLVVTRKAVKELGFKDRPVEMKVKSLGMLSAEIATASFVLKKLQDTGLPANVFK